MSVYDQLQALNIQLPAAAVPAAAYVPFVQTGNLVFLSGHIAKKEGQVWAGQLGANISTEEGKQAARAVAIDLLGTLQVACGGDLNRVQRIIKVMSLVNSTPSFTEQHLVTNGLLRADRRGFWRQRHPTHAAHLAWPKSPWARAWKLN